MDPCQVPHDKRMDEDDGDALGGAQDTAALVVHKIAATPVTAAVAAATAAAATAVRYVGAVVLFFPRE